MARFPSRKSLEAMKRADLQRLCKDYGVKANLKSEALIDLLLDTQTAPPPPQQTRRSVSTRQSSQAGPSRVSSVVIHDTDEENEVEDVSLQTEEKDNTPADSCVEIREPSPPAVPPPRTRKAKDLQVKLGVGKPVVAGGRGPRAVTKSMSVSRSRRGKTSKTLKPTEATIVEEPEPAVDSISVENHPHDLSDHQDEKPEPEHQNPSSPHPKLPETDVEKRITEAIRPLSDQITILHSDFEQNRKLHIELAQLRDRVATLDSLQQTVDTLAKELKELRDALATNNLSAEVKELRDSMTNSRIRNPSTPPRPTTPTLPKAPGFSGLGFPSAMRGQTARGADPPTAQHAGVAPNGAKASHPGVAPSMLGKRHRDSTPSTTTNELEAEIGDALEIKASKEDIQPTRKRAKTSDHGTRGSDTHSLQLAEDMGEIEEQTFAPRGPSFTVFQGPDEHSEAYVDPPPPTNRLPDYFAPNSPSSGANSNARTGPATSSATAPENQHPFSFSFLPLSSTSASSMFMPSFPYPEPPQSPSPADTSVKGFMDQGHERIFKSFGLPSPIRPTRQSGAPSSSVTAQSDSRSEFVNPAALTRGVSSGKQKESSSSDVTSRELSPVDQPSSSDPSIQTLSDSIPIKRTMYGTELDGDSRFGDFGAEGVANLFWTGKRY